MTLYYAPRPVSQCKDDIDSACYDNEGNPEVGFQVQPDWDNTTVYRLYESGVLNAKGEGGTTYSFDGGGHYSPLQQVEIEYINVFHPAGKKLSAALTFKNHKRQAYLVHGCNAVPHLRFSVLHATRTALVEALISSC